MRDLCGRKHEYRAPNGYERLRTATNAQKHCPNPASRPTDVGSGRVRTRTVEKKSKVENVDFTPRFGFSSLRRPANIQNRRNALCEVVVDVSPRALCSVPSGSCFDVRKCLRRRDAPAFQSHLGGGHGKDAGNRRSGLHQPLAPAAHQRRQRLFRRLRFDRLRGTRF